MFHYFRRIRYKLLDEGHLTKYVTYALGEIVLVVAGILIALQVNDWQVEYSNSQQEKEYLQSLKWNISADIRNYESVLNASSDALRIIDEIAVKLNSESVVDEEIDRVTFIYLATFGIQAETSTIEDLKSTGNLDLIKNREITEGTLNYYRRLNRLGNILNTASQQYSRDVIGPYLMANYGLTYSAKQPIYNSLYKNHELTLSKLKSDLFLINALDFRRSIVGLLNTSFTEVNLMAHEIILLIDDELDTGN